MTSLELILSEIPDRNQCPPPQATGRNRPKTKWLAGKKFPSLGPLYFLPTRRTKKIYKIGRM